MSKNQTSDEKVGEVDEKTQEAKAQECNDGQLRARLKAKAGRSGRHQEKAQAKQAHRT